MFVKQEKRPITCIVRTLQLLVKAEPPAASISARLIHRHSSKESSLLSVARASCRAKKKKYNDLEVHFS